ncbi:MAG: peptidoglycan-binding protein [Oscillospiraceae bacterium]|nr:peptidoglycan-binding protein [Oscillospiraceae bacterium]
MNAQYTPDVFPGTNLQVGSSGSDVLKMQNYLNVIGRQYQSIPQLREDGLFGYKTDQAVRTFQRLFSLNDDGIIGPKTWNKIVEVHTDLSNPPGEIMPYPGTPLIVGARGESVSRVQSQLNRIRQSYPSIPHLKEDGIFGKATQDAVIEFQRQFLLPAHGAVEETTWYAIENAAKNLPNDPLIPWDGTILSYGSIGDRVKILQQYLNDVGDAYPSIPLLAVDGKFGVQTQNATMMFQHLFDLKVDGIVGEKTWNRLLQVKSYLMRQK